MIVKGYSELTLSRAGVRTNFLGIASWGAYFKLDADVSELFPYINSIFPNARYHEKPEYIHFFKENIHCALYSSDVIVAPMNGEEHAREFAGEFITFLNDIYNKKDSITPSYKKYKPASVLDVFKLLPRTNCKECGFPTCMAFAAAISGEKADPAQCPEFSSPIAQNAVYPVYDKDGKLASTVTLEVDSQGDIPVYKDLEKYIESLEKELEEARQRNDGEEKRGISGIQSDLTEREIEVLCLIAEGATNTEISEKLFISPHTVKSHVVHIFNKLGVNDRTQAAVWATRNGLV